MGWTTGGERAARTNAKTAKANREHQERQRDLNRKNQARQADVNWERKLQADFSTRNQIHKVAAFDTERQEALRENRPPRFRSPEDVPDLQPPPELVKQPKNLAWLKWTGIIFVMLLPLSLARTAFGWLPEIIYLPILAVVVVTEIWVVQRIRANGDPQKLANAEKWNPKKIATKYLAWASGRRTVRATPPQNPQSHQDNSNQ